MERPGMTWASHFCFYFLKSFDHKIYKSFSQNTQALCFHLCILMCPKWRFVLIFDYLLKTTDESERKYVSLRVYRNTLMMILHTVHSRFFWSLITDEFQDAILVEVIKHKNKKKKTLNKSCLKNPGRTFIMHAVHTLQSSPLESPSNNMN